ncbi:MAG: hypothetical protein AAGB93_21210 [Planctomycetota bacterium]
MRLRTTALRAVRAAYVAAAGLTAAALATPLAAAASGDTLDPRDGPDVDLRIAIEDDEVRFQIITNLAFLDETTDAYREDESRLDPAEAPAAMDALVELFERHNEVAIDGNVVRALEPDAALDFEYDPGNPSHIPHFVNYGARAVARTRLTLRYACKAPPRSVSITWGVYPPNAALMDEEGNAEPMQVMCRLAAGGVDRIVKFQSDEPQFIWHRAAEEGRARFADVPPIRDREAPSPPWLPLGIAGAAALGLAVGPRGLRRTVFGPALLVAVAAAGVQIAVRPVDLPTADEAVAVFEPLHENIYRAFDYTDESDVYDALAQSVDGPLLESLYDEVYRSLVLQEAGGAVSRVAEVRHLDLGVDTVGVVGEEDRPGFVVDARWQVDGAVYHWGHAHTRTNEYRARYTVHAADEGWRIAASEVLEQRRVDAAPISDEDLERALEEGDPWRTFNALNSEAEDVDDF